MRLDNLFCKYKYKGKNPFASRHVKQTPHDPELMWSSNMYLFVIKVSFQAKLKKTSKHMIDSEIPFHDFQHRLSLKLQGRTVDLKTLTLIEEPAPGDDVDSVEEDFERILRESGEQ